MELCLEKLGRVFVVLRKSGIHASTHEPPCCRRCGHATLRRSHASYVFFTASCVVDEPVHELHLGHAFESADAEKCTLSILRRFFDVAWDGDPNRTIRVRPKLLWEPLRRWMRARAIAVYWFELTARLYAPGGVGRKRDREEFEAEMRALRIV